MAKYKKCRPYTKREINDFGLYVMSITGDDNIKTLADSMRYSETALFRWFKTDNILKLSCLIDVSEFLSKIDKQSPQVHLLKILNFYPIWRDLIKKYERDNGRV